MKKKFLEFDPKKRINTILKTHITDISARFLDLDKCQNRNNYQSKTSYPKFPMLFLLNLQIRPFICHQGNWLLFKKNAKMIQF